MAAREAGKRRTRLTLPVPAEAVVDPRLGARGPALLALEDGTVFPGIAFGAPIAAGGDLVVNTSQTGYQEVCTDPSYAGQVVVMTYPLIGNYGRLRGDDQSERPWLRALVVAHATAGGARTGAPAGHLLRDERRAGHRRRRHAGAGPPPARDRLPAGDRHRPRRDRPGRARSPRPARCRAGRTRTSWRRCRPDRVRRASGPHERTAPLVAIVDFGLKANIVRRARGGAARGSGSCPTPRPPPRSSTDDVAGVVLSPGPGDPARLAGPVALARGGHRRRPAAARASASATRSSAGAAGARRAGSGSATTAPTTRSRTSTRAGCRSPPRTTRSGRRRHAAARPAASASASSTSTTGRVEGLRHASCRSRRCSTTPRARPGRSTRWRCSTASWPPAGRRADAARGGRPGRRTPPGPLGAHHRLRAGRHRPGGRVRLRRHAGLPGAARGGRPDDPASTPTRPRS